MDLQTGSLFQLSAGLWLMVAATWLSGIGAAVYLVARLESRR